MLQPLDTPGCVGRRNGNVNLDELRWDRSGQDCEPPQARGIPRNLQLGETRATPTRRCFTSCVADPSLTSQRAVRAKWGVVPLLDMLTKAALRTGCPAALTPLRTRREIDPSALTERLKLLIYAYGTNTGVRAGRRWRPRPQRGQPALYPQPVLHRPRLASDS